MAASFLRVRVSGVVLLSLLLTFGLSTASAQIPHEWDPPPGRWTFIEFSLTPPLAVFRSDSGDHPVPLGKDLPGTRIRLDALSEEGATVVLASPDGRPLRLRLLRGQELDAELTLRELAASLNAAYPPASPEGGRGDAD